MDRSSAIFQCDFLWHDASISRGFKRRLNGKIRERGNLILISSLLCVIISTGSFAWGYRLAGFDSAVSWIIVFGVFWFAAQIWKWRWFSLMALALSFLLAVFGIWFGFVPGWMFGGAIFAVLVWDLTEFPRKLKTLPARDDLAGRTRRHIFRISFMTLAALAFTSLLMYGLGQWSMEWGYFILGVMLLMSLQFLAWIKNPRSR